MKFTLDSSFTVKDGYVVTENGTQIGCIDFIKQENINRYASNFNSQTSNDVNTNCQVISIVIFDGLIEKAKKKAKEDITFPERAIKL
jgi:hypothetical protein